ncbi:MAG TPA: hypothetical protein VGB14_19565 [Acidimicrobiales bacterium]|jgi:hypothetical protein
MNGQGFDWNSFSSGVNPRFLLPLKTFHFTISFLPLFASAADRERLAGKLLHAAAGVVEPHPYCELRSLRAEVGSGVTDEAPWAVMALENPMYGFLMNLYRDRLVLTKGRHQIRELVESLDLIRSVLWNLFPTGPDGQYVTAEHSLIAMGFTPTRVTATLNQTIHLGTRIGNEADDVKNPTIFARLARIGDDPKFKAAFDVLQMEDILRGDIKVGFNKEVAGSTRQCWVTFEAPWNVTQRDIDMKFELSTGDKDAPLRPVDLADLSAPVMGFYKSLILQRFFPALFGDVNVAGGML